MPYWDKEKLKWRGTIIREGNKKYHLFDLKSAAKEWEVNQKALPLEEFLNGTPTVSSLAEWSESYLDHVKAKYVDKTYAEKQLAFRRLFQSIKANSEPSRLHPGLILKHFNREAKERSGNAANKDRKNLIAGWNWAIKYLPGWPEKNLFVLVERQQAEQCPRYIPPVEDFWKVFDSTKSEQDKIMLLAYLHTAGRKTELFDLTWDDIEFDAKRLRLWTRKRKGGREYDWIPMTTELQKALEYWRENSSLPESPYVFVCEDAYNLSRDFYGKPFESRCHWLPKLCERAGVKKFGFHAIRHLSASILDDAGYPITVIQTLLRHKSAATTARYLHKLRGMRTALDDAFKRKSRPETLARISARPLSNVVNFRKSTPKSTPTIHGTKTLTK